MKRLDYLAWRTGEYIICSIGTAFNSQNSYPEHPVTMQPKVVVNEDGKEEPIDKIRFMQWAMAYNKKHGLSDKSE